MTDTFFMINNQKGLSTPVILIIVAAIVAILIVVFFLLPGEETESNDTDIRDADPSEGDMDIVIDPVKVPIEDLPLEWVEWLNQTYPDVIEYYSEGGVPIELVWELERVMYQEEVGPTE